MGELDHPVPPPTPLSPHHCAPSASARSSFSSQTSGTSTSSRNQTRTPTPPVQEPQRTRKRNLDAAVSLPADATVLKPPSVIDGGNFHPNQIDQRTLHNGALPSTTPQLLPRLPPVNDLNLNSSRQLYPWDMKLPDIQQPHILNPPAHSVSLPSLGPLTTSQFRDVDLDSTRTKRARKANMAPNLLKPIQPILSQLVPTLVNPSSLSPVMTSMPQRQEPQSYSGRDSGSSDDPPKSQSQDHDSDSENGIMDRGANVASSLKRKRNASDEYDVKESKLAHKRKMNAEAARRCRERKAQRIQSLEDQITTVEQSNAELIMRNAILENERRAWKTTETSLRDRVSNLEDRCKELEAQLQNARMGLLFHAASQTGSGLGSPISPEAELEESQGALKQEGTNKVDTKDESVVEAPVVGTET
ncbi:uncharacterized protein SPPG_01826 [Spizellomyces punctatus DAOM BR117]|uniref:BZIP domain-containing protein n=1 Tax=Spizellomyces punctatus (strain DAOM BR117) TaxID=645134 RepID=A0A0L0HNW0_SPIPD|nr:uncharacterized protein SPPG_01826 [Spizellomyces punctatus DAOM BR117]KND02743.1 hypothetical protein SPPG_01826 [Spizellomyces punctatus DAOM BR117]|eukprot:XP_016610782.1 hypothetical protein SPPG_01826 [Spizellomyces punctatus DAOM BR117]